MDSENVPVPEKSRRGGAWLPCLLLAMVALAAFATAFPNRFTNWDDPAYITEYRLIRGFSWPRLAAAFSSFHVQNYNPLQIVSYMTDYALWGLNPRGYVLTSVLFHVGAGLLVWKVLRQLTGKAMVAGFGAVVFLVHPTRSESVVWLSERKDVMAAFFSLLSVWCYLNWSKEDNSDRRAPGAKRGPPWPWYSATIVCFLLALLSKSQVVTLPLVFLGIDLYRRRSLRAALLDKLPLLALSGLFSVITLAARATEGDAILGEESLGGLSLVRPLTALPYYAAHLLFPRHLSPLYAHESSPLLAALGGLPLLILAAWGAVRSYRSERVFLAGTIWFFSLLLPVSGLVPNQVLVADRYLYVSAVGLAWIAGEGLSRTLTPGIQRAGLAAVTLVLVLLTAQYNVVWRNSATLWTRVLEHAPECPAALANLGMHYLSEGHPEKARRLFEADLREFPSMHESFFGMAEILRAEGSVERALHVYEELLDRRHGSSRAVVRYAAFLNDLGRPDAALRELEERDLKRSFSLHQVLFRIRLHRGEFVEARKQAILSVKKDPFHEEGWYHLGVVEERLGRPEEASSCYRRSISCGRSFQPAYEALVSIMLRNRRPAEAAGVLLEAPQRTPAWWNLNALCLFDLGRREESLRAIREATRRHPENRSYWANRARLALRSGRRAEAEESVLKAVAGDARLASRLDPELRELLDDAAPRSRD